MNITEAFQYIREVLNHEHDAEYKDEVYPKFMDALEVILPNVAYVCDRRISECCCLPGDHDCTHTTDISHAVNFEKFGDKYIEKEREEKTDDILIIKCDRSLREKANNELYEALLDMKSRGVILLPPYCEVIGKTSGNVKIVLEENDDSDW